MLKKVDTSKSGREVICPIYLYKKSKILKLVSEYRTIKNIARELNIKPNSVYKSIKRYMEKGLLNEDKTLTSKGVDTLKSTITGSASVHYLKSDTVRLHNLVFTIKLSEKLLKYWKRRRQLLTIKKIHFDILPLNNWERERIIIDSIKVWLTPKSIIIYMPQYYGKDETESADIVGFRALVDLYEVYIPKLMKILQLNLVNCQVNISRNHYALIKNIVAKKYYKEKKKLYIRAEEDGKFWLVIDNSLNLKELETVHKKTAMEDNITVKNLLNDLRENPTTFSEVRSEIKQGIDKFDSALEKLENQALIPLTEQIKLHLEVQKETLETLKELKETIKKLADK